MHAKRLQHRAGQRYSKHTLYQRRNPVSLYNMMIPNFNINGWNFFVIICHIFQELMIPEKLMLWKFGLSEISIIHFFNPETCTFYISSTVLHIVYSSSLESMHETAIIMEDFTVLWLINPDKHVFKTIDLSPRGHVTSHKRNVIFT